MSVLAFSLTRASAGADEGVGGISMWPLSCSTI
jgi:hypothetical protein